MKKIFKTLLIILFAILIPALIIVVVLYVNDKELLNQFLAWINQPSNLSAFLIGVGCYFPVVNGIWKLAVNIITTRMTIKSIKRNKVDKIKVFDDDKNNYIYYDDKNNIIDVQFKSPTAVEPAKLIEMMDAEIKNRIRDFIKKQ